MNKKFNIFMVLFLLVSSYGYAGPTTTAIREVAESIFGKFGKGAAGKTLNEVTEATARAVAKHGDDALPFLRKAGHAGFEALEQAGNQSSDVIKLFARNGDEALYVISKPNKLAIFLKHGDSAADALIKHPGIADDVIGQFGGKSIPALNAVSRQGAQEMGMVAKKGVFTATERSPELFGVIEKYGDRAMNFIWRHKGALAGIAVLTAFLNDPEAYFSGVKTLVVDPILSPIAKSVNWTLIISGALIIFFLPTIVRIFYNAQKARKIALEDKKQQT